MSDNELEEMRHLQEVLAEEQLRRAQLAAFTSHSSSSSSPDGDTSTQGTIHMCTDMEDDNGDLPASSQLNNHLGPYTLEEGRALKRTKNLSACSEADAEAFLKTVHPMQHAYQLLLIGLKCHDKLTVIESDHDAKYTLSNTLKKTCMDYAHVAILSPSAKNYQDTKDGPTVAASIQTVMQSLGVAELPAARETGCCVIVNKCLIKGLTEQRCHVKTVIFESLTKVEADKKNGTKSAGIDIASLTRSCINTTPANPTAFLYQRIVFIRYCAVIFKAKPKEEREGKSNDDFWIDVDKKLAKWRKSYPNGDDLQIIFNSKYNKDKELYDMEDWLTAIDKGMLTPL
ncbi:hypothetical protein B0H10DRAFT_2081947 [Mycena sp. CBHHK59/15]|nr:hypothetical protein B0H10DRAFT_2081947 [Mycena sp. CBHHK59/15]